MKKLIALMLTVVMALSVCVFTAVAEEPSITATVTDGSVKIPEDLSKLIDGNDGMAATAFGDSALLGFENTGFTHTDGVDAAVEATVEFVYDLGETKSLKGVFMNFFKDTNSMIAVPSVNFYVSTDGKDYYDINALGAVNGNSAEETKTVSLATQSTRAIVAVRYIKAVATFKNGWIFASEIGYVAEDGGMNPAGPFTYKDGTTVDPGIGLISTAGTYDLSTNESSTGELYKNAQITIATYEESTGAYKIRYNKCNPWPDGHAESVTLADNEIMLAVNTGGSLSGNADSDVFSGVKWILRGMKEGDYVAVDTEAKTVSLYPSTHTFESGSTEPEEPENKASIGYSYHYDVEVSAIITSNLGATVGEVCKNSAKGEVKNHAYWDFATCEWDETEKAFVVTDISLGGDSVDHTNYPITDKGFVLGAHSDNAEMTAFIRSLKVGDKVYTNVDIDNLTNDQALTGAYVTTKAFEGSTTFDIYAKLLGTPNGQSAYTLVVGGPEEGYKAGEKITVTVSLKDVADKLSLFDFKLFYDATKVTPVVKNNKDTSNQEMEAFIVAPTTWEIINSLDEEAGCYCIGISDVAGTSPIGDGELDIQIEFTVNADTTGDILFYIRHDFEDNNAAFNDLSEVAGNGSYAVVSPYVEPEVPPTGDYGMIALAVLAVIAMFGSAIVIKSRR